jgi:hypothetical protein
VDSRRRSVEPRTKPSPGESSDRPASTPSAICAAIASQAVDDLRLRLQAVAPLWYAPE